MFDYPSRALIRELAIQAGFKYDAPSCNLLTPDEGMWINKELWKFAELVIANSANFKQEQ